MCLCGGEGKTGVLTRTVTLCYASNVKGQGKCAGGEETGPVVGRLGSAELIAKPTRTVGCFLW